MAIGTQTMSVVGTAFVLDDHEEEQNWWAEGESARMEVQRTDDNEIRLGVMLRSDDFDAATFYCTPAEAARLAFMLGKAVLES